MKLLPLIISLSLIAVLAGCFFIIPGFQNFIREAFDVLTSNDQERIRVWVNQFGLAGPLILILIMVVQMFMFVVPNVFVMMVAIVSYGHVWGAIISFLGVLIGRYLGPVTVNRLMSASSQKKTADFIKNYGVPAIAITRISSLSNDSLSIVAGLLKMSYKKYILATLGGITPLIVLLAIYGRDGRILKALAWVAGISLVILIVYIIIDKKGKKAKGANS